jgi:C4-dicarboxylate transporter DctQ subunit
MTYFLRFWPVVERRFEEACSCFCLSVMASCVFAQVIARYLFNTAITWTEELAGFSMVWAVYMGASLAVRERFHIRIMIGVVSLPRRLAIGVVILSDLCWMAFNVFMIWFGVEYLILLWERVYISPSLQIDQKWPQMIVAVGYTLMAARLAQVYYHWVREGCRELPGIPQESQQAKDVPNE